MDYPVTFAQTGSSNIHNNVFLLRYEGNLTEITGVCAGNFAHTPVDMSRSGNSYGLA